MSQEQRLAQLLRLYANNDCTKEEFDELFALIDRAGQDALQDSLDALYEELPEQTSHTPQAWNALYEQKFGQRHATRNRLFRRLAVAAAFSIICLAALFYFKPTSPDTTNLAENRIQPVVELTPGGNVAMLTLANGKKIPLNGQENGLLATEAGVRVTKTADGRLVYQASANGAPEAETQFNTIETPKGGQYEVILPDGSHVWLNAMSSLRFPARFSGTERGVILQGEAYFEVARHKTLPFRVQTERQQIEVLGTHFNVNSYADEQLVRTTLLEGSVKVIPSGTGRGITLTPGQQAVLDKGTPVVRPVDTDMVMGWKKGYFVFNNNDLESIMRQVSRWYDVDIEFKNDGLRRRLFSGTVSRFENASQVLDLLELTGIVHFKVEGRRIIVM